MQCKEVNQLLSAYQDGRLTEKEREGVKSHLQNCVACQNEEQALSDIWNMLNVIKPIEPSPGFKARFWQRVREEESAKQNWRTTFVYSWREFAAGARPAFALTSVLVVSVLGVLLALKIFPETAVDRSQSPILEWAQSTSKDFMGGGL